MELIVGMGDYAVTDREEDVIKTFALASCVAVTAYSAKRRAAGMVHVVLPSPQDSGRGRESLSYYARTGVPLLIETMCQRYGLRKEELDIQMYGGAESALQQDVFNIGRKNIDAVKHTLLEMGLTILKADLRGSESRTLVMDVKTGQVEVHRQPITK